MVQHVKSALLNVRLVITSILCLNLEVMLVYMGKMIAAIGVMMGIFWM